MVLVAGLTILSPAYLHFTGYGAEFAAALPDAPDNPHSDALCDKIYASYQSQIQNLQDEKTRVVARAAKDPEGVGASAKNDIARLDAEASDLSTQGLQVRDDCYVKVANWQTDQKGGHAKPQAGTHAAPQTFAARPETAPLAATPTAAAPAQPMQVASAAQAGPPARAYVAYAAPASAKSAAATAVEAATAPSPIHHRHARRARSGVEYASASRRSHRTEAEASVVQAYYPVSEPRVEVGSYDKILVANADGVVRIPADGVTGVERVSDAGHSAIRLASVSGPSASRHRHGRRHIVRARYRPHARHHALTVAQAPTAKVYAPTATPAGYVAVSLSASAAPSSSIMAIPAHRAQTVAPPVVGRTTSGLDPPAPDKP